MKYAHNYYLYVDNTSIALSRWELHFEGTVMASQFSATKVCGKIWQSERSGLHFEARGKISRLCRVYYEAEQEKISRMPDICFTPAGALCSHCREEDEAVILVQTGLPINVCSLLKKRSLRQPFKATQIIHFQWNLAIPRNMNNCCRFKKVEQLTQSRLE